MAWSQSASQQQADAWAAELESLESELVTGRLSQKLLPLPSTDVEKNIVEISAYDFWTTAISNWKKDKTPVIDTIANLAGLATENSLLKNAVDGEAAICILISHYMFRHDPLVLKSLHDLSGSDQSELNIIFESNEYLTKTETDDPDQLQMFCYESFRAQQPDIAKFAQVLYCRTETYGNVKSKIFKLCWNFYKDCLFLNDAVGDAAVADEVVNTLIETTVQDGLTFAVETPAVETPAVEKEALAATSVTKPPLKRTTSSRSPSPRQTASPRQTQSRGTSPIQFYSLADSPGEVLFSESPPATDSTPVTDSTPATDSTPVTDSTPATDSTPDTTAQRAAPLHPKLLAMLDELALASATSTASGASVDADELLWRLLKSGNSSK